MALLYLARRSRLLSVVIVLTLLARTQRHTLLRTPAAGPADRLLRSRGRAFHRATLQPACLRGSERQHHLRYHILCWPTQSCCHVRARASRTSAHCAAAGAANALVSARPRGEINTHNLNPNKSRNASGVDVDLDASVAPVQSASEVQPRACGVTLACSVLVRSRRCGLQSLSVASRSCLLRPPPSACQLRAPAVETDPWLR